MLHAIFDIILSSLLGACDTREKQQVHVNNLAQFLHVCVQNIQNLRNGRKDKNRRH